jgi:hypothetical protein
MIPIPGPTSKPSVSRSWSAPLDLQIQRRGEASVLATATLWQQDEKYEPTIALVLSGDALAAARWRLAEHFARRR